MTDTKPTTALAMLDQETGEVAPMPLPAVVDPYAGISSEPVTEEQAKQLMAPVADAELDILPTGEIYLSQIGYRRRLNQTFRPGGWALRPLGKPTVQDRTLMQEWALYVNGRFISSAWGEADYHETNDRQSWATATESLKSNALMRCCKDIGIASECWDRHFTEQFKAKYCVKVWRREQKRRGGEKGEYQWRRKDAPKFYDEGKDDEKPGPEKPSTSTKPAQTGGVFVTSVQHDTDHDAWLIVLSDKKRVWTQDALIAVTCEKFKAEKTCVDVLTQPGKKPGTYVLVEMVPITNGF